MDKPTSAFAFLSSGGITGEKIAAYDWSSHRLGPIDEWSPALRTALSMVLNSGFPTYLVWGEELFSFFNDAYLPQLGIKADTALGRPFSEVWAEAWDTVGPIAMRAMAGEASSFTDLPIVVQRHGQPEQTYFTFSYSPVRDELGIVRGVLCTVFETTDKVVAITRYRESEERLRLSLDASGSIGTWTYEEQTDLVFMDERLARIVGKANAATGTGIPLAHFTAAIHHEDRDRILTTFREAVAAVVPYEAEYRLPQVSGEIIWIAAKGSPFVDMTNGRKRYAGVAVDITERRRVEEQLHALNLTLEQKIEKRTRELMVAEESLRQAQKMEAVGQLTGGIAHDFNNMLHGMLANLELMRLRIARGQYEELNRYIDSATSIADRAAALTHGLLAFSRRQTLDPKPTDVRQIIASFGELVRRIVGPAIVVREQVAHDVWRILCDLNHLESALLNLAINARDAMPNGGVLTIEASNFTVDNLNRRDYIDLPTGEYVCIAVSDNGSGMAPDVVERAFDPFFTTKPLGQGTGLGLSMIYGFVRQSGGDARILSEPGRGTIVRLALPKYVGGEESHAASAVATLQMAPSRKTVLLVDDEVPLRALLAEMLGTLGYDIIEAVDGDRALEVVKSERVIDALITDVGLPGTLNGRQLADQTTRLRPGIPVLLITGYAEGAVMGSSPLPEGLHLMTKPFGMASFATKVRALLDGV